MSFSLQDLPPLVENSHNLALIPRRWGMPCVQVPKTTEALVIRDGTVLGRFPLQQGGWHIMPHGVSWHFGFPQAEVRSTSDSPNNQAYSVFPANGQRRHGELVAFWAALDVPIQPMMAVRNHNVRVIGQVSLGFRGIGTLWLEYDQGEAFAAGDYIVEEYGPNEAIRYPRVIPHSRAGYEFWKVVDTTVFPRPSDGRNQTIQMFTPETDPYQL